MADSLPSIVFQFAGWRCRLTTDTRQGDDALARLCGSDIVSEDNAAMTTLHIALDDGPTPRLQWRRDGQRGDFEPLFSGPERKRFLPMADDSRCLFADSVAGDAPMLELRGGDLLILQPDAWVQYVWHALTWLMLREHPLVALHAAACAVDGVALLIVGPSGCGKSTLSWALAQQGADYFSDESAFLRQPDCRLFVRPQRVSLRSGGVATLAAAPDIAEWFQSKPNDRKCAPALPTPKAPCPQDESLLLFVEGFGDAPALAPLTGGDAARRLAAVMGYGEPSPLARLAAAADIVSRLPCRALTIGKPEETAAALIMYAREAKCRIH